MKLRQARTTLALVLVFVAIATTVALRRRPLPAALFAGEAPPEPWSAKRLGREHRPLLFVTRAAYPPFSSVPPGGEEPRGLDVDVAREVASALGVEAKIVAMPWQEMKSRFLEGEGDVLVSSASTTAANRRSFEFTAPYYRSRTALLLTVGERQRFRHGVPGEVTVAALTGSSSVEALRQRGGATPVSVSSWEELVSCLQGGRCDAALVDVLAAHHLLSEAPASGLVLLPAAALAPGPSSVSMAVRKGSSDLRRALDGALRDLQLRGALRRIHRRYYPFDIE